MADSQAVWGIDIGQAGLKAIRLRYAEAADQVIAIAFDYIPHAKILSQPDAVPDELIQTALSTFLSRNQLKGDLVAISVPGQSALTRFIQLPPVESSKVDEIVRYEAKQQIPFALEDVIWDYQTLGGGIEESGYMLGAEVGLFAMKKEGIHSAMKPFLANKMEVELVQLAPLALHNFLCFDQIGIRPGQILDGEPDHMIVLDMGTDNTTLLVTNGNKIWVRNVPIGGNHFTRALTKEMKLTFAKAEHLKCNATKAPDPRAVFQALRPVFNDYVAEIQRSIGYFSSVNRDSKITKIVGAGNGFKLAGLQKFLQQNLQYEVERADSLQALVGDTVLNAPLFQENVLSFAVPYGLALQALKLSRIHTTLLPPEIATARKIRRKKPWAVATAATLLFGLSLSTAGYSNVASSVSEKRFGEAEKKVEALKTVETNFKRDFDGEKTKNTKLKEDGVKLVTNLDTREMWLEVYRAVSECLPRDVGDQQDSEDITQKNRVNIKSITAKKYADVSKWFDETKAKSAVLDTMIKPDRETGPKGIGYVFTLVAEHYRNGPDDNTQGLGFVQSTLLQNLNKFEFAQPGTPQPVPIRKLGLSHACVTIQKKQPNIEYYPRGKKTAAGGAKTGPGGFGARPMPGNPMPVAKSPYGKKDGEQSDKKIISRFDFTIQFCWIPTANDKRLAEDPLKAAGTNDAANLSNPNGAAASPAVSPSTGATPAASLTPPTK
ncbi:MAG: type IV pilus assembly protein PilM [Planctomycetia bacterium]|nr:type IV pilus assembly protein PilM [Planctomycetia bacterium]